MSIYLLTIICCSFIVLVLALYSGRNIKTAKEYITGNTSFGRNMLSLTLIATLIGSGDFRSPYFVARNGIAEILMTGAYAFCLLLVGKFIAPKMEHFKDCYTPGDIMHKNFGPTGRLIAFFVSLYFCIVLIVNQLRAIKYFNAALLGMDPTTLMLLVGTSVVVYTAIGGIKGVVKTDAVQFFMVFLVLFIITRTLIAKIGGFENFLRKLPAEKLSFFNENTNLWKKIESMFFWPLVYVLALPMVIRVLLTPQGEEEQKKTYFQTAGIYVLLRLMLVIVGLGALVYFQNTPAHLDQALRSNSLISYLANDIFGQSRLIQAFLFLGMLFALSSTLDSYVHALGIEIVVFISHFFSFLKPLKRLESNANSTKALLYIRIATLLIGVVAVFIVLTDIDLPLRFYGDTVVIGNIFLLPFVAGILGLKTDGKSLLIFSTSYCITFFFAYQLIGWYVPGATLRYKPFWLAMGVSSTLFFITHYFTNNGFAFVQRNQNTKQHAHDKHGSSKSIFVTLKQYIPTPKKLALVARANVGEHGRNPLLFTIFIIGFWLATSYDSTRSITQIASFYGVLQGIGLALCTLTMALSWAKKSPYYDLLWFVTVGYCIPYAAMLVCFTDINNPSSIYSLLIAFIILLTCVNWRVFAILSTLGISGALLTYRLLEGHFIPTMQFETAWQLILAFMSISMAAFFFTRKSQKRSFKKLEASKILGGSIGHETKNHLEMGSIVGRFIGSIVKNKKIMPLKSTTNQKDKKGYVIDGETLDTLKFMGRELVESSQKSSKTLELFTQAMDDKPTLSQKGSPKPIRMLIEEVLKNNIYLKGKSVARCITFIPNNSFNISINPNSLQYILVNLVQNAINHGKAKVIRITLNKDTRTMHVRDNGVGIPVNQPFHIFDLFASGANSSGIGLPLVKYLIEAFGGDIRYSSKQDDNSYTEFVISFPNETDF